MSDKFKPLFVFRTPQELETKEKKQERLKARRNFTDQVARLKQEIERLRTEKEEAQRAVEELRIQLEKLKEENGRLTEEIERLKQELDQRDRRIEALLEELRIEKTKSQLILKLKEALEGSLSSVKDEFKDTFIHLSKEVIKEFLMSDSIPKEDVVRKILEETYSHLMDIRGTVKIFINPEDMGEVKDTIEKLKENLHEAVTLEVIEEPSLKRGEIMVDTPKFVIERKHGDIFEEVFREAVARIENEKEGVT